MRILLHAFTVIFLITYVAYPAAAEPEGKLEIPKSLQVEHAAIHTTLVEATKVQGPVGAAAKTLAEALHSHFDREEGIALPPLGVLARLADGVPIPDAELSRALSLSDSLRRVLPHVLGEHSRIGRAVESLREAAKAEHMPKYEMLADQVALHAQHEEEVLYPAAMLVGDLIRARQRGD